MAEFTLLLLLALKLSVGAIILAIGMDSTLDDVLYLWRRPGLLVRSLVAMYVLVPLVAFILVKVLTLPPAVEIALLILAVSAGAPLLPRKLLRIGDGSYIFSLVVISTVLAIVIVPTWLTLLGPLFGDPKHLTPIHVALVLTRSFFGPLALGMLIRWLFPAFAKAVGERLLKIAGLVLTVSALVLLALNWQALLEASWLGILTLAVLLLIALAIGHWLGGPEPDNRTALAIACSTRHIGIVVLVAASLPGPRTAVIVAVYILTSAVVSIAYLRWRRSARTAMATPVLKKSRERS